MSTSPRHAPVQFAPPDFPLIEAERDRFLHAGLAPNTVLSYARDWRVFTAWCAAAGRSALPASPETVELYASDLLHQGRKVTTLERHAAGIQYQHRIAGLESPCGPELRALLSGARRVLCQRPNQKEAITLEELRRMVRATGWRTPIAARNTAILLFGFASALRRSNLASLRMEHLTFTPRGILVWVDREKQDREGSGRQVAVPAGRCRTTCPVRAIRRWLDRRGEGPGPLFCGVMRGHLTGRALLPNRIGQIVQESAARIGLDPNRIGAHSLRAGFCTEGLERGVNEVMLAQQTGHRSLDTLRLYLRSRDPFRGNACAAIL